jgi:hypothetical protein
LFAFELLLVVDGRLAVPVVVLFAVFDVVRTSSNQRDAAFGKPVLGDVPEQAELGAIRRPIIVIRSSLSLFLLIPESIRHHCGCFAIERNANSRLDPKQPIARICIPAARDRLDRDSFRKSIGNFRAAELAPRRDAIVHRPDDTFYCLWKKAENDRAHLQQRRSGAANRCLRNGLHRFAGSATATTVSNRPSPRELSNLQKPEDAIPISCANKC